MPDMPLIWLVAIVVFAVGEAATVQFISLWFACGALAALLSTWFGAPLWLQLLLFAVTSAVLLALTRPFLRRFMKGAGAHTNYDRIIGQRAVVTQEINNLESRGQARVGGQIWTARSASDEAIPEGKTVEVVAVEGVKAIVKPIAETEE